MEIRREHPEVLGDFEAAPARRVRRWAGFGLGLWLMLLVLDWTARFQMFRWQDQWVPARSSTSRGVGPGPIAAMRQVPAQTGAGLTQMVPVSRIAARYAEFHPAYTEHQDAAGYCNPPLPEGGRYSVVMLGDSFMLSLGTQNVAQVLASVGGIHVYNHAMRGAGPFLEMRKFISLDRFDPPPKVVVWNLSARELGAPLFMRQSVNDWFDRSKAMGNFGRIQPRSRVRWDLLAPSVLRKAWPNTSLCAYFCRQVWGKIKLVAFGAWPSDVFGAEDSQFGPMLFYGENLRVLPLLTAEADAPAVLKRALRLSVRFQERGMALVVLLVPEKEQIHSRALPVEDQQALARGAELLAAIEAGLREGGVPVVNLMPVFQDATARGQRLYWRDDTHWNDAGIRLAAEELWRVVEPLLK